MDMTSMIILTIVMFAFAYVGLRYMKHWIQEEGWQRDFMMSESGGGGTPFQPSESHYRKYLCEQCSSSFLFIEREGGPVEWPACPFCGSFRVRGADANVREEEHVTAGSARSYDSDASGWWPPT